MFMENLYTKKLHDFLYQYYCEIPIANCIWKKGVYGSFLGFLVLDCVAVVVWLVVIMFLPAASQNFVRGSEGTSLLIKLPSFKIRFHP